MPKCLLRILKPSGIWAKLLVFVALLAFVVAMTTGRLALLQDYLDTEALSLRMGDVQISAYDFLTTAILLILLFWISAIVSDIAEKRIGSMRTVRGTTRTLLLKVVQIGIYIVAGLVAMDVLGLDLTTLAVFGGALGIGLGFGLQKIASNFISGLILLAEKSVEIGDLVELPNGVAGFVRKAGARYTLLETFDGKEILVPNEDLITSQVTNWTLSSNKGRIEIPVGVAYGSDLEKVIEIMVEAAKAHPRTIAEPGPQCFATDWGDSSVNFILLFWVDDVTLGRREPQSDVMLDISRRFEAAGIVIPFPQRDVHLQQPKG